MDAGIMRYWCAVFRGKPCDCDDDGGHREPRRRRHRLAEAARLQEAGTRARGRLRGATGAEDTDGGDDRLDRGRPVATTLRA